MNAKTYTPSWGTAFGDVTAGQDSPVQIVEQASTEVVDTSASDVASGTDTVVDASGSGNGGVSDVTKPATQAEQQLRTQVAALNSQVKKWKRATIIVSVCGVVLAGVAGGVGYVVGKRKSRHLGEFDEAGLGDGDALPGAWGDAG